MGRLVVHNEKLNKDNVEALLRVCPFGALDLKEGKVEINAACKMCKLCVKKGPAGVMEYVEEEVKSIDKDFWKGIAVYVDHEEGHIHPVTLELIGKARELADKVNHPVYAIFIGHDINKAAEELLYYGVDEVFVYNHKELEHFRIEPYTAVLEDFINSKKPSTLLVGATTIGRSLAPRVAARFRTGLTADCTILDIKENTDLIQIRPAFGGNIMAQIINPNNRPQLATVRYKVMNAPEKKVLAQGKIVQCNLKEEALKSNIEVLSVAPKEQEESISEAETIVVVGRAIKSEKDMELIERLAKALGAQIAFTRPLIEAGIGDAKKQIGLSGRTVKPKLIITLGVSGAVQFTAGMGGAEHIFAINKDANAPIFNVAHYGIVGDIYEIVPKLLENIEQFKAL